MDKSDIIWWPDNQKGVIINAITARDRASLSFVLTRVAKLVFPMLLMTLGAYGMSRAMTFPDDTPELLLTVLNWAPPILLGISVLLSVLIGLMAGLDWRRDTLKAEAYQQEARDLGVNVDELDSNWVFETLVLPMVRHKGIQLPNGEIAHIKEE